MLVLKVGFLIGGWRRAEAEEVEVQLNCLVTLVASYTYLHIVSDVSEAGIQRAHVGRTERKRDVLQSVQ